MYIPQHDAEPDVGELQELIRAHPLGAWVTPGQDGLIANHIPFVLDPARGEFGTLEGHVARANPVWQQLSAGAESVVIFQGPESYISPSWYQAKSATGRVVPTWNYVVVHAHGVPNVIEDRNWILRQINRLTDAREAGRPEPWKVSDAPAEFVDAMSRAIVGIEIPVRRLEGRWKLSRNRSEADRRGVIAGLNELGDARSQEMAGLVDRYL